MQKWRHDQWCTSRSKNFTNYNTVTSPHISIAKDGFIRRMTSTLYEIAVWNRIMRVKNQS